MFMVQVRLGNNRYRVKQRGDCVDAWDILNYRVIRGENMTEQDEKIRELERRITVLENYPKPPHSGGKTWVWTMLGIVLALFLVMTAVGVIQFVSAG